jgi:DNA (cytosine-5)-methyltransferase 1
LNELSLFTGAGGGLLGSYLLGWTPVGYVEINEYCQKVIAQRIKDGILPEAPIFGDIKTFSRRWARGYQGLVDVVTAGFPCQPWSLAGKRLGSADKRNMWPWTIKTIRKVKPAYVLLENVPGILNYLPVVIRDLRQAGYTVQRPLALTAAAMGAGHLRNRIWVRAHLNQKGQEDAKGLPAPKEEKDIRDTAWLGNMLEAFQKDGHDPKNYNAMWKTEPGVVRVVYGVSNAMDRVGALGEGQVPAVVRAAWEILSGNKR